MLNNKRVLLITGGAGFIGSNFLEFIQKKRFFKQIIVVDKLTYAGGLDSIEEVLKSGNIEFIHGDVTDASLMSDCVSRASHIIHFAAETHVTKSLYDARDFVLTDVLGTQNLMSAIVKYKNSIDNFIHVSTSEVYGTALSNEISEEHPLNPLSPYAGAKCGADRLVYSYMKSYDLKGFIIRPFNNYGPKQHLEKLVPRIITSALSNTPIKIHGNGDAQRDWVYVKDTCEILSQLLIRNLNVARPNVYNLGSGISTSVLDITKIILAILKISKSELIFLEERPGQVLRHTASIHKLKSDLNLVCNTDLVEGMGKTIEWYIQNESWWSKRWESREIEITLPNGKKVKH